MAQPKDSHVVIEAPDSPRVRALLASSGAIALGVLVLTGIVDLVAPAEEIRLRGQEKADYDRAWREARWYDGTLARQIEQEMEYRSRVRSEVGPYWAASLLRWGTDANSDVVVGKDGWLFLRARASLDEERRRETPIATANTLGYLRRAFARHGAELCVIPLPRKAVVCADKLPDGFEPHASFDADVIAALGEAGVPTIDLLQTWIDMPSEHVYQAHDTHWNLGGLTSLATAVKERYEHLAGESPGRKYEVIQVGGWKGLLQMAGIDMEHPARLMLGTPPLSKIRFKPRKKPEQPDDGRRGLALSGSSFSNGTNLDELLAESLGRDVEKATRGGAAFTVPLLELWPEDGGEPEWPELLLYEFHCAQAVSAKRANPQVRATLGRLATRLSRGGDPLFTVDSQSPWWWKAKGRQRTRLQVPSGSIAADGNGVVLLELEVDSDVPTRWQLRSGGGAIDFTVTPDAPAPVLPVLGGHDGIGTLQLVALDPVSRRANIRATFVTDAALTERRAMPVERRSGDEWLAESIEPVDPLDVLVVRFEDSPGAIEIDGRGTDDQGQDVAKSWAFAAPVLSYAVLSLSPFENGAIGAVSIRGRGKVAEVSIAPLRR